MNDILFHMNVKKNILTSWFTAHLFFAHTIFIALTSLNAIPQWDAIFDGKRQKSYHYVIANHCLIMVYYYCRKIIIVPNV